MLCYFGIEALVVVGGGTSGLPAAYDAQTGRVVFEPGQWPEDKKYWKRASKPFGNISIAATDAASNAMTESAIEEAYRAVSELGRGA